MYRTQTVFSLAIIALWLLLAMCSPLHAAETVQLWVTVDWEGLSLEEDNLQAMQQFRQKFPHIPLLHLINPAYFTQPGVQHAQAGFLIRSTFLPHDTVGLHLHPMRHLVEYCGLAFQATPALTETDETCTQAHCGYSVSLEYAYSQTALTQMLACASELMVTHGFNRPRHFRAGAWQMGPKLQAALEANHYTWDSSIIDASLLIPRWPADSTMVRLLRQLHPHGTPLAQPLALGPQLMEFPDNAALADYTTTQQLLQLFAQLIAADKAVMVLGFHQETAADYLLRLEQAIPKMETLARQKGVRILWMPQ